MDHQELIRLLIWAFIAGGVTSLALCITALLLLQGNKKAAPDHTEHFNADPSRDL
ncbi:MAG: hypothetical protein SFY81_04850 [Verrucomicrobiota bacterium]|nr:hypothetical protein [Verrucomicrobiota bacterium]